MIAADAAVDFQMHTTYSDGTWTPEGLIDYLAGEGFGLAAITDHDRVDTAATLQRLALQKGMPLLVAAEFSTEWKGHVTDVLCFGFDPESSDLNALTQDIFSRQQENTREVYAAMRPYLPEQIDVLSTILEIPRAQQPPELSRLLEAHVDKALWEAIFAEVRLAYMTNEIGMVVDAMRRSGGVCLIVHPGRGQDFALYDEALLDQLREEVPIDGIEAHYPLHTPEQTAMFVAYAQKHHLLTSSGSDSHGSDRKPIKYAAGLSRELLERLGVQVQD